MPNVLGLDVDTARQALIDAGIDDAAVETKSQPFAGEKNIVVTQVPGPGAARAQKAVLSISAPATMPAVVSQPVTDARKKLNALGARVVVEQRFSAGSEKEGTVLASDPASGTALPGTVKLVVAEAPSSVFLTALDAITSDCSADKTMLDGRTFEDALTCDPGSDEPSVLEYALNKRVSRFAATVGVGDRSAGTSSVTFRVIADGHVISADRIAFGHPKRVDVSIAGALRLRLETQLDRGTTQDQTTTAVWGNARVLGGRSGIDALEAAGTP